MFEETEKPDIDDLKPDMERASIVSGGRRIKRDFIAKKYMSLSDWERGKGRVPAYLPRLLEYYVRMEKITDGMGKNETD